MRSSIEKQCDLIAKGQADKEDVVALSLANFQLKFNYFVKNIHRMDTLFEASFSPLTAGGKPWSKCGLSNRYLQLIVARPQRLYNKNTEQVYSLPQGGSFKLWSERVCPVEGCGFELSLFQVGVGKDQRTYPLCPNCYNQPRPEWGPANTSKGLCIECPHADGHPLVQKLTLCADDETGAACTLPLQSSSSALDPKPYARVLVTARLTRLVLLLRFDTPRLEPNPAPQPVGAGGVLILNLNSQP